MADLALTTTDRVYPVSGVANGHEQYTFQAGERIRPGQVFRIDTSTGVAMLANASALASAGQVTAAGTFVSELFVAIDGARQAGNMVTGIKRGELDGFDLTNLAYGAPVYLSNTAGTLADAAGAIATIIGRVRPSNYAGTPSAQDKVLAVSCPPYN